MNPTQRIQEFVVRMTPDQYARLLAFAEAILNGNAAQSTLAEEAELLQRIQQTFPEKLRLRELTRKSEAEILNAEERSEYITLAEQGENADAERLQSVIRLAQLRGVSPAQLLTELSSGVGRHG